MHLKSIAPHAAFALALTFAGAAFGQTEADIIERARADYPLETCVVSDEALGPLDDAIPYVHRATGQPDRVLFLCCEGCIDDFKQDPPRYLKKLETAAKAKPTAKPADAALGNAKTD